MFYLYLLVELETEKIDEYWRKNKLYAEKKEMTRKELSIQSGLSEAAISRYINGTREPKMICIKSIAKALDTSISFFIDNENHEIKEIDDAVNVIARNAKEITPETKRKIIDALMEI